MMQDFIRNNILYAEGEFFTTGQLWFLYQKDATLGRDDVIGLFEDVVGVKADIIPHKFGTGWINIKYIDTPKNQDFLVGGGANKYI